MPRKISQLLPNSVARRQADAWRELESQLSEIDRIVNSASRTASSPDRAEDRLVPQVFGAKILNASAQTPVGGKRLSDLQRAEHGTPCRTVATQREVVLRTTLTKQLLQMMVATSLVQYQLGLRIR